MPARKKPAHILEAKGAFKKNPNRKRTDACQLVEGEIGNPPDYFSDTEKAAWFEIVENAPKDVLAAADRMIVEVISRSMAMFRSLPPDQIKSTLVQQINSGLARLGMSPVDRARVTPIEKEERNPFEDL